MLHFITATRSPDAAAFNRDTLTGQSLERLGRAQAIRVSVGFDSRDGLPVVYNAGIDAAGPEDTLVFLHDDVRVDDWQLAARLDEALARFDLVGVAGNTERAPGQATWFGQVEDRPDGTRQVHGSGQPRGGIGHLDGHLDLWSHEPAACRLIDGVFLAMRRRTLLAHGIRFDPRFRYHFYDQDLCRQCEHAGLSMGVWPIALTHRSGGRFDAAWAQARQAYFDKWGD